MPRHRHRYRKDHPANHKQMKKVWNRDPWHWFHFDPLEVAEEAHQKGDVHWSPVIASCKTVVMNKKYQVLVFEGTYPIFGKMTHLYIQRRDGSKIRPWGDFQRIKNELVGPDHCAVEVYPHEDELVDDIDMWHLWVFEKSVRMPFHIGNARPPGLHWTFPGKGQDPTWEVCSPFDEEKCKTCGGRGKVSCVSNPELCEHGPYQDGEPCHYGTVRDCSDCTPKKPLRITGEAA